MAQQTVEAVAEFALFAAAELPVVPASSAVDTELAATSREPKVEEVAFAEPLAEAIAKESAAEYRQTNLENFPYIKKS